MSKLSCDVQNSPPLNGYEREEKEGLRVVNTQHKSHEISLPARQNGVLRLISKKDFCGSVAILHVRWEVPRKKLEMTDVLRVGCCCNPCEIYIPVRQNEAIVS